MKLNECPSEHSSYGLHCSCIRQGQSSHQCCHCGHKRRALGRHTMEPIHGQEQVMTLCVRWIYEDDLELQSEISKYCDHGYCHGRGGPMSSNGYIMEIAIERLPSGNYNLRNERGYLLCEVISGSELAKFAEKHLERGVFTLRVDAGPTPMAS